MATYSNRAEKDLARLPDKLQARARQTVGRLDAEPALGKKLLGKLAGLRSARLGRSHRVVYKVRDDGVFVVTIRPRKDAY